MQQKIRPRETEWEGEDKTGMTMAKTLERKTGSVSKSAGQLYLPVVLEELFYLMSCSNADAVGFSGSKGGVEETVCIKLEQWLL